METSYPGSNRQLVIAERQKRKLLKKQRKNPNQVVQNNFTVLTFKQYIFVPEILEQIWKHCNVFTRKQFALTSKAFYASKSHFFTSYASEVLEMNLFFLGCCVKHIITDVHPSLIDYFEFIKCNGTVEKIYVKNISYSARTSYENYYIFDVSNKICNSLFVEIRIYQISYTHSKHIGSSTLISIHTTTGNIHLLKSSEQQTKQKADPIGDNLRATMIAEGIENSGKQRRSSVIDDQNKKIKHVAIGEITLASETDYNLINRETRHYFRSVICPIIVTTGPLIFKI